MLFPPRYLEQLTRNLTLNDFSNIDERRRHVQNWITSIRNGTILSDSETQLQNDFLKTFFAGVLQYSTKIGADRWSLDYEFATRADATHADGYLGFFTPTNKDVRAVIELKDARSNLDAPQNRKNDRRTPVEQAFSYAHKTGGNCRWVIVSNFLEIRLYHAGDSTRYQRFTLENLADPDQLLPFLALLDAERLIRPTGASIIDDAWAERREAEERVTDAFYQEFSSLRLRLFEHLVDRHPDLPELDLFAASQKLLDRLVFIFFCEDTDLLPYKTARSVIEQADSSFNPEEGQIWQQLRGLFRSIDLGNERRGINRFNGGLFAVDQVLDQEVKIGDEMVRELLRLEAFDFESELDVNILGHIFEQSISDIEETKAKIVGEEFDEKKGKRKKDGVFYTPPFITRYIVDRAIGAVLDDWRTELGFDRLPTLTDADYGSIKQTKGSIRGNGAVEQRRLFWTSYREKVADIRVLDPACGSGAFLVAAFDRLRKEGETINDALADVSLGQTTTSDLRREILQKNLYGVDINAESVEITKLSLWLKTADRSSVLTSLDQRIRVGNSIVDDPEASPVPFNWKEEFPDVFGEDGPGGFDVVVGNPPYVRQELLGDIKGWLQKNYSVYAGTADLYVYFFERGVELLRPDGLFSIVVANKWMRANYGEALRQWMAGIAIEEIVDFGDLPVFRGITTYPCIVTLRRTEPKPLFPAAEIPSLEFSDLKEFVQEHTIQVRSESLDPNGWTLVDAATQDLLDKLRRENVPLGEYVDGRIYRGVLTGLNEAFVIDRETRDRLIREDPRSAEIIKPFLAGRDIKRYMPVEAESWLILFPNGWTSEKAGTTDEMEAWNWLRSKYPAITEHLKEYEEKGRQRYDQGQFWWELRACDYYAEFEKTKLFFPDISLRLNFTIDASGSFCANTGYFLTTDSRYVLGILNSSLIDLVYRNSSSEFRGGYLRAFSQYLTQLPIHPINESDPREVELRSEIESHVDRILALNAEAESLRRTFLKLLTATWSIDKLSTKLETWHELMFEDFLKELGKKKIRPDLKKTKEWMEFFEEEKERVETLLAEVKRLDGEIDEMVGELYGVGRMITEEDGSV